MERNVNFHIGYPKTGSTSIQNAFDTHRMCLREHSILYPRSAVAYPEKGHHNLPRSLTAVPGIPHHLYKERTGGFDEIAQEIRTEVECDRILISSEGFNHVIRNRPEVFRQVIGRYFGKFDIRIVVFVRRGDDYIESMFLQLLREWRTGRREGPVPYLERYIKFHIRDPSRHLRTIFNLLEMPYGVEIRRYAGDSVEAMCEILGYRGQLCDSRRRNERLTAKQAALLYWLGTSEEEKRFREIIASNPNAFQRLIQFQNDTQQYRLIKKYESFQLLVGLRAIYKDIERKTGADLELGDNRDRDEVVLSPSLFAPEERDAIKDFFGLRGF